MGLAGWQQVAECAFGRMKAAELVFAAWMGRTHWKPQHVFDICFNRFSTTRGSRFDSGCLLEKCKSQGMSGPKSRPDVGVRLEEYRADFVLAGRKALRRPRWEKRLELFQLFFVDYVPYRETLYTLRIPKGTADWWMFQIRCSVGFELARRGLFPPPLYFTGGQSSYVGSIDLVRSAGSAAAAPPPGATAEVEAGHEGRLVRRRGDSSQAAQGA